MQGRLQHWGSGDGPASANGGEGARCALSVNAIEYITHSAGKYVNVLLFD